MRVRFRGAEVEAPGAGPGTPAAEAAEALAAAVGGDPATVKLLLPGGQALGLAAAGARTLAELGVGPGATPMLLCSGAGEVAAVRGAKEDRSMPSFAHEEERERRRRRTGASAAGRGPPSGPYTFGSYHVMQGEHLTPSPERALKLLHKLANDPGIRGVMAKHRWDVGRLVEFPPEGQVGVSGTCLLGYNKNAGQEIGLRLRTDKDNQTGTMHGFRKYLRIRETLIHELAHM